MIITRNPIERFWEYVNKTETCWLWTGFRDSDGYGKFQIGTNQKKKSVRAHRFSYELVHGPTELLVLHNCDNPPCVNPDHLYAGTHSDNMKDMYAKGRANQEYWTNPDNHIKHSELMKEVWVRRKEAY